MDLKQILYDICVITKKINIQFMEIQIETNRRILHDINAQRAVFCCMNKLS